MPKRALVIAASLAAVILALHMAGGTVLARFTHGAPLYLIVVAVALHAMGGLQSTRKNSQIARLTHLNPENPQRG